MKIGQHRVDRFELIAESNKQIGITKTEFKLTAFGCRFQTEVQIKKLMRKLTKNKQPAWDFPRRPFESTLPKTGHQYFMFLLVKIKAQSSYSTLY